MGCVPEKKLERRSRETAFVSEMVYQSQSQSKSKFSIKRARPCTDSEDEEIGETSSPAKRRYDHICQLAFSNPLVVSAITQYLPTLEDITDFANTCRATREQVPMTKLPFHFKFICKWTGFWDKKLRLVRVNRNYPKGSIVHSFIKSVVVCIDRSYLTRSPGNKGYQNPTMDRMFIKQIMKCVNIESLKIVSVGFNTHHCNDHFNGNNEEIFSKLKHVHLEDVHLSFENLPEVEWGYRTFEGNVERSLPLSKYIAPAGLLKLIFRNRNIETIKIISMIIESSCINAMQKLLDNNRRKEDNQKRLKKVESVHLEDIVVSPDSHASFDKFMCDLISNANTVPVLSLQIHKHSYGASLIGKLCELGLKFPRINLLISLDAVEIAFVDALDRIQDKAESLKLQFYEPDVLEDVNDEALKYMFSKWGRWENVAEVIIGKELHIYSPFDQDNCIPIIENLYRLPNLQKLGVADRCTLDVFVALAQELNRLRIVDLTLTLSDQFKTRELNDFSNDLLFFMIGNLPRTLTHFSACALPLTLPMIKKVAVNNQHLQVFCIIQSFSVRTDEQMIKRKFKEANNVVEVEFHPFEYAKSKSETTAVSHWLNMDRSHVSESPIAANDVPDAS